MTEERIYIVSTRNLDGEPYSFTLGEVAEWDDVEFAVEAECQGWVWSSMWTFAEDWNGNCERLPRPEESEMRTIRVAT